MEKFSNTKATIQLTLAYIQTLSDTHMKEQEQRQLLTLLNRISEATIYDIKNSMNDLITDLNNEIK